MFAVAIILLALPPSTLGQLDNSERDSIPPGPCSIAGRVVNAKTGSSLARVRVTVGDTKNRQSVKSMITADDGRFEFHVPAGKYSLSGAKRGFIAASYNQHDQYSTAIVTGSDFDTENLVLRLAPNAVLGGHVFDEFQDPVRNAQITVYRENHFQGVSRIDRIRNSQTDDQGHYEITGLNEGTYFVSVSAAPWYAIHTSSNGDDAKQPAQVDPALDVVYPITYYGNASETDGAIPIPVRGGDRLQADIHLTPAPSAHLIVHMPDGGSQGFTLQKSTFDGMQPVSNDTTRMIAPGVYEVSGVAAGRYSVRTFGSSAREAGDVDVAGSSEVDLSSGSVMSNVKIAVQIAGESAAPSRLAIGLRNSKGHAEFAAVDAKGVAEFSDIIPGKYDIVAGSQGRAYSVVRIDSEAGSVSGHALNVPAGASLNVTATLTAGSVTVEGFAKRDGKSVAGAMIVLVPKDPEANHDRFRRDQSDLDGSFSLQDVIPGSYTVIAIDDGWDLNWSDPAVLAPYLANGQTVETGDRATNPMHLAKFVPVQDK